VRWRSFQEEWYLLDLKLVATGKALLPAMPLRAPASSASRPLSAAPLLPLLLLLLGQLHVLRRRALQYAQCCLWWRWRGPCHSWLHVNHYGLHTSWWWRGWRHQLLLLLLHWQQPHLVNPSCSSSWPSSSCPLPLALIV
jgi:hypothetical protein